MLNKQTVESFELESNSLTDIIRNNPEILENTNVDSPDDIESIELTAATELEFWG